MKSMALLTVLCFLWASSAFAEMKFFPKWETKHCFTEAVGLAETDKFACYNFEATKLILKVDLDMQLREGELDFAKQHIVGLQLATEKLRSAIVVVQENRDLWKARVTEKQKSLEDIVGECSSAKDRDVLGGALPWVITAGVVLFLGGIAAGYAIFKETG